MWGGSEGGLFVFDPAGGGFVIWTNTDGLAANDITAVVSPDDQTVWIGLKNGLIQRINGEDEPAFTIEDYRGREITALALRNDTLFVGLDIGLSIYLTSRSEVRETYRRLGTDFQVEIPVRDILLRSGEIWVATDEGVASSRLDYINLLDPQSWTDYTTSDGLPSGSVRSLISYEGMIYAGTSAGLGRWDDVQWDVLNGYDTHDAAVYEGDLVIGSEQGVFKSENGVWQSLPIPPNTINHLTQADGKLIGGTDRGLVSIRTGETDWTRYVPNSIGSNLVSDVAVDAMGEWWCTSRDEGFFRFDGLQWVSYNRETFHQTSNYDFTGVQSDTEGRIWLGNWGSGIVRLDPGGDVQTYHPAGGYLSGVSENPNYCVITDLNMDPGGNLWILNYRALNNQPLVAVTTQGEWVYYGNAEGIPSTFLRVLTIDESGMKWMGSESHGLIAYDDNGTPSDKSDDPPAKQYTVNDGLETNRITAIAADSEGAIWIGTPEGLHYLFGESITRRYGLPSDNISALIVDGADNLWVGTNVGLSIFSNETYNWKHFTTDNSGLVSDDITALQMDYETGDLFIATSQGLSVLTTPFSQPRPDLTNMVIYPSPFVISEHQRLTIDNLAEETVVQILTVSGFPVRSFTQSEVKGRLLTWDGTNDQGNLVAGGIYVVVAFTASGEHRVGKIALVR